MLIMPATVYLFGPLIDAPPSHPDIVQASLIYMETSLGELGMTCANLSIDMQLYMVGQVKWWEPDIFSRMLSLGQEQCTLPCPSSDVSVH